MFHLFQPFIPYYYFYYYYYSLLVNYLLHHKNVRPPRRISCNRPDKTAATLFYSLFPMFVASVGLLQRRTLEAPHVPLCATPRLANVVKTLHQSKTVNFRVPSVEWLKTLCARCVAAFKCVCLQIFNEMWPRAAHSPTAALVFGRRRQQSLFKKKKKKKKDDEMH